MDINVEWIDYKDSKIFSIICPKCVKYRVLYYEPNSGKVFPTFGRYCGYELKINVITIDIEIECLCGHIYVKKGFKLEDPLINKKCEFCGDHMNILCTRYIIDYTSSKLNDFTKDDLLNILEKYGFCTTDLAKYGYKLRVESTENTERVSYRWYLPSIDKTVNRKKLVVEKI
jgi:predicted Ser/Thr protein kinase